MRNLVLATGLTLALAGPALAQSPAPDSTPSGSNPAAIQQQVKQNLAAAGFSDIKVMPESFLVRAKDKTGNPVMMIINPDSITAVTAMNGSTLNGSTMGGSTTGGSARGGSTTQAAELSQQQKQEVAQIVGSQPSEPTPPNFQPSIGQTVPPSVTLKPLPTTATNQLPPSLQGAQFAKLDSGIMIVDPSTRKVVALINPNGSK